MTSLPVAQYKVCPTAQRGVISLQNVAFSTQYMSATEIMFVGNVCELILGGASILGCTRCLAIL